MSEHRAERTAIEFEQAEHRFQVLQAQHRAGELDGPSFRLEVAKLVLCDGQDTLWMLDADSGTWTCHQGEGWQAAEPPTIPWEVAGAQTSNRTGLRRWLRWVALGTALLALFGLAGAVLLWQQPEAIPWNSFRAAPAAERQAQVAVVIASPADGSQVSLGPAVAIESTIQGIPNLQPVTYIILEVDGQVVDMQSVQPRMQPGQTSLPLSQAWLPATSGEHRLVVTALSPEREPLGTAAIKLTVLEAPADVRPESACMPGAAFVADVTMPPGAAFPPGARMDKVWQVRNSGTCAWGVGYELVQLAGVVMGAPGQAPVPPTTVGGVADMAVTLWAPAQPDDYVNIWQLRDPQGDFFGPTLPLSIHVEVLAPESLPPVAPADLNATLTESGDVVQLTWSDRSDNEDAFRIHRGDMEASIGLVPANAGLFIDEAVACGNSYRYSVTALNAAGASAASNEVEATLPPCAPVDEPPTLSLTIVPTQVRASGTFTVVFEAHDDFGLNLVAVWAEEADYPSLHSGRFFSCTQSICVGAWPVSWTQEVSATLTWLAVALDSSGQESALARRAIRILMPQHLVPPPHSETRD